jgi:hypothetical protein
MGRKALTAYIVLGAISFINMLAIATVEVMALDTWLNPLYGKILPRFIIGNFDNNRLFLAGLPAWLTSQLNMPNRFNLGQLLFHLKGHLSLVPWVAVTSTLGLVLYRRMTKLDQTGCYHKSEC